MIEKLSVKNFKSWANLPVLEFGKVTALFGANSSGKTSLIQLLLMLKQTVTARDRGVLNLGGTERDFVDLGSYEDIVHGHKSNLDISFGLTCTGGFRDIQQVTLEAILGYVKDVIVIKRLAYHAERKDTPLDVVVEQSADGRYTANSKLFAGGKVDGLGKISGLNDLHSIVPFPDFLPPRPKKKWENIEKLLISMTYLIDQSLEQIFYLGPLREYPHRDYRWSGEKPTGIGVRGEQAVQAMLSRLVSEQSTELIENANEWPRRLGMADQVELRPIAKGTRLYEFVVRTQGYEHEANLMDVGFGVSQVLPIIVMAHFAPPGSLLILEQPEIHLHPQVQTELADLFLETALKRNIQFLIESHSEHLLMRLQRRLAERKGEFADLSKKDVRLYFCKRETEASALEPLELDEFGRIKNWPKDFFGDAVAERRAMTEAMLERQSCK